MRNRATNRQARRTRVNRLREWWLAFSGLRSRLLIWYFLLTICITLVSVLATFKIFCDLEEQQAGDRLQRDIDLLQQLVSQQKPTNPTADTWVNLLDRFVAKQVQDPYEYLFLVVNGQLYRSRQTVLPEFLRQDPNLIARWAQPIPSKRPVVREGYIIRVVQPIQIDGQNAVVLGIYDATLRYQMGEKALIIVVQVTLVALVLFSAIAWLTAGRLLSPLHQLRETARAITETDLSRRLTVRGTDEIAELALTFNNMLDRLQAAFTSQQDFIKDVSHELRTPITIIRGHLELLGSDPQEQQETIALVRDELKRMSRFVNDLLLLMRAERPNFLRWQSIDLETFTEELFAKARGLATRNWQLEAKAEGEMFSDRQRISQVILNLAQNATQYTQEGDTIALGTAIANNEVRFWVRDTGEGIDPEDQERIFDRFARGSNSERRSEGSGLGLSIVYALVKAHNGHVELFSRLGEGARFTVVLPRRQPEINASLQGRGRLNNSNFYQQAVAIQHPLPREGRS
ncbi:HAMP domain-containing histidine kinase [Chroococcidiopsis sp. FACHB-1243]|uniref:sensor histidine kinase n=1 Tax=Chroococcidiopsis sp. [FACHB-1243] TaxID=2692781 RepID=UPI00177D4B6C|nr:HAMP domain-containing sensor histidine kinase [Chroococcidiopsis sp. [FACHB-1243]]MBD2308365.1 HAMP domain-containing histidine kinase [Chroococcidiopsis sp. [FACHB-1243]]